MTPERDPGLHVGLLSLSGDDQISVKAFHEDFQELISSSAIVSICQNKLNSLLKDLHLHCLEELVGPVSPVVSGTSCWHCWRVVRAEMER